MPAVKFFTVDARVSGFAYQLGLDRLPEEETRSPQVQHGDPAICAELEKINPFKKTSTNFAISWLEYVPGRPVRDTCCELTEDVLLIGVPGTRYIYSVVEHEETATPKVQARAPGSTKRSAGNTKVVTVLLPSGGHLEPIYPKREIQLVVLYLALLSIRNGWASPMDRGRERNGHWLGSHPDLSEAMRLIEQYARNAERLPDGSPDAQSILGAWRKLGVDEVYPTTSPTGRRGISMVAEGHPKRVRFFGREFEAVHKFLKPKEIIKNESHRSNQESREALFPGGYLVRDTEHTDRIEAALKQWLGRRADHNRKRFNIGRTPFVAVGFAPSGPGNPPDRREQLLGAPAEGKRGAQVAPGRIEAGRKPDTPEPIYRDQVKRKENHAKHTPAEERTGPGLRGPEPRSESHGNTDPELPGAPADLGVVVAFILELISRIFRVILAAVGSLTGECQAVIESRIRRVGEISAAADRLGEQGRHLDAAIESLAMESPKQTIVGPTESPPAAEPAEFLRVVKKPIPPAQLPGLKPIPTPNAQNLGGPEPQ